MTDTEFLALVNADARGNADEAQSALLRSPENLDRWRQTLITIIRDVEDAHVVRRARLEEAQAITFLGQMSADELAELRQETASWRARVRRFQRSITDRVRECNVLLDTSGSTTNADGGVNRYLVSIARRAVGTWVSGASSLEHDLAMSTLEVALAALSTEEARSAA